MWLTYMISEMSSSTSQSMLFVDSPGVTLMSTFVFANIDRTVFVGSGSSSLISSADSAEEARIDLIRSLPVARHPDLLEALRRVQHRVVTAGALAAADVDQIEIA